MCRDSIFKLLRSPGTDSASLCSLAGQYGNPASPVVWTCRVYSFPRQQYERAECIPFPASSMDVLSVFLSTASSMEAQGVSLFPPPAVWTCRVYFFHHQQCGRAEGTPFRHKQYERPGYGNTFLLKGQCHEIFCFWFFYESVSPQPQSIPLGPF